MNKDEFSLYHWEFYVDHVAPDDNDIIYGTTVSLIRHP